jgi:hypothetical protein
MAVVTQLIFLAVLCPLGHASEFLGSSLRQEVLDQAVFAEMFGGTHLESLQAELLPTFNSLPKNQYGKLEHPTVRYALHRYFIQKHGWFVKGLDPEGGNWEFSSSSGMVKEKATQYIQDIFDKKLQGRGLGLEELASFAAIVADLIHGEGLEDLEAIYRALSLSVDKDVSLQQFDMAVRGFLSQTIVGFGVKLQSQAQLRSMENRARSIYPEYDDIVMWTRDMQRFARYSESSSRNPFVSTGVSFDQASAFMKLIQHHFGSLLNLECQTMKEDLVQMQVGSSGRVLLSAFYSNRKLQLHESYDYMKNLGVIEESDKHSTRLVIPNYISSKSRCLPFSGFYSVCCPDECQSLLGSMERGFSAPTASPEMIIEAVSRTVSTSALTPPNVSAPLTARLRSIADLHGGQIPLHSRLFMQWLHHVYPLECPFPHVTGTVKAVSQDQWLVINHDIDHAMISEKDRARHIEVSGDDAHVAELPWSDIEELIAVHQLNDGFKFGGCLRVIMGLLLLVSFLAPSRRALSLLSSSKPSEDKQLFV